MDILVKKRDRLLAGLLLAFFCVLTFVAAHSRLQALQAGYGPTQEDEDIARAVVVHVLRTHEMDTNWIRTDVDPAFRIDEYNFSPYYLFSAGVERAAGHTERDLRRPDILVGHVRQTSAILGALCILLAGILGWRMAGKTAGLVAAVLTAASAMLYEDSLFARPESFVTVLSLLYLILLTGRRMPGWLVLTLAGLLLGLLIACKVTFLIYLPFLLMLAPALRSMHRDETAGTAQDWRWVLAVTALFLALGIGFYLGAPYAVRYPWEYLNGLSGLIKQYRETVFRDGQGDRLVFLLDNVFVLRSTIGVVALGLSGIGILALVLRKDLRSLLIVAGPLATLGYFMGASAVFERNFSHALPVLFVCAGMGVQFLLSFIRRPALLRGAATAALLVAAAVTPLRVMAELHTALDGEYKKQVQAEVSTLTQQGWNTVIFAFGNPDKLNGPFCGSYVYMEPYYDAFRVSSPDYVPKGYRIVGQVRSVFGDRSISTLQIYYAPSYVFVAPPQSSGCELEMAPLLGAPGEALIPAPVHLTGAWTDGGAHAATPATWHWPLYGSWSGSDAHMGSIQIGPFHACGDIVLPVTAGRAPSRSGIEIRRRDAKGDTVLFDGVPPVNPSNWAEIRVHQGNKECGTFTISGYDKGAGWEDWVGVGRPVAIP